MNPLETRAKQLRAQMNSFSKPKKKLKPIKDLSFLKNLTGIKSVPSPYLPLSKRVAAIGAPKPPVVVEKHVYHGERGERGPKGDSIKGEKGNDGFTPKKGVHYFDGKDGKDGRDGYSPRKGIDYFTSEDLKAFKAEIFGQVKVPEAIVLPEVKPLEVDAEFVKKIVQIMHSLPENDKLEVSKGIRNAQSFIYKGTKYGIEEMMHGGGSSSGGNATPLTPTGTVNAVNAVFGVTARPSSVVSDGITYFEGAGYSYAALSITLDVPPSQYIRYYL